MDKGIHYTIKENGSKYFITFNDEMEMQDLHNIAKSINHVLKPFDGHSFVIANKIELHLKPEEYHNQIHAIEELLKDK